MGTRFRHFSPVSLVGSAWSVGIVPPPGARRSAGSNRRRDQSRSGQPGGRTAWTHACGRYKVPDFALQTAIRGLTSASCAHQLRKSGIGDGRRDRSRPVCRGGQAPRRPAHLRRHAPRSGRERPGALGGCCEVPQCEFTSFEEGQEFLECEHLEHLEHAAWWSHNGYPFPVGL